MAVARFWRHAQPLTKDIRAVNSSVGRPYLQSMTPVRAPIRGPADGPGRRHFVSVGTKLTGAVLLVLSFVTLLAYFEVSRNEREQVLSAKEHAATMVTELFAA